MMKDEEYVLRGLYDMTFRYFFDWSSTIWINIILYENTYDDAVISLQNCYKITEILCR